MMHKCFFYGTLKTSDKDTHTIDANMWNVGLFPCVKLGGNSKVTGQVVDVTSKHLNQLDKYEGVPHMYTRQLVKATDMISGKIDECWVYEWARDTDDLEPIEFWE